LVRVRHALAACIALAVAAAVIPALAAGPLKLRPGMTGVPDLGAIRCETFSQMHPAGPTGMEQAVLTWAGGYIYGRTGKTLDEVLAAQAAGTEWNFDTLTGHIVSYCAAHPQAPVPEAVADLWAQLQQ
jgi:hypothetical protein